MLIYCVSDTQKIETGKEKHQQLSAVRRRQGFRNLFFPF